MPDIELTAGERDLFVDKLGIRPDWIADAMANPDKTEILSFDDGRVVINLYRKHLMQGRAPSLLLVVQEVKPRRSLVVMRLYDDFGTTAIEGCESTQLMGLFARRFGTAVIIGGSRGRIYNLVEPKAGHAYHFLSFLPPGLEPVAAPYPPYFALDLTAYQEYLRDWS